MSKLEILIELMQIAESAFVYKLKKKNPNISQKEIEDKICAWYLDQAMLTPFNCVSADLGRFK